MENPEARRLSKRYGQCQWARTARPQTLLRAAFGSLWMDSRLADVVEEDTETFKAKQDLTVLKSLDADTISWVHTDLKTWNIVVQNGNLGGTIDWENSGWYPRHVQLHLLRHPCSGSSGRWNRWRKARTFDPDTGAAYESSFNFLTYPW